MAGNNAGFDAREFREAIRSTMVMGLPNAVEERPTFKWSVVRDYPVDDPADDPYDWTATPATVVERPDVQVACAVEFAARVTDSGGTVFGDFDAARCILTLLDEDYETVRGADKVKIGGNTYAIEYVAPPMGLFEVTVYQVYAVAEDES